MNSGTPADATVTVQLENEPAIWMKLDGRALGQYAKALARGWSLLGLSKGDKVAIFDYGSSPATYLASSAFFPHLQHGAADILGCLAICCDGVPQMLPRLTSVLRYVKPRAVFLRADALPPFEQLARSEDIEIARHTGFIVVTQDEGFMRAQSMKDWQQRLGLPVYSMLRIDRSLFLAMECPACHTFHTWSDLYDVRVSDGGQLAVKPAFATHGQEYVSPIMAELSGEACDKGQSDKRIIL